MSITRNTAVAANERSGQGADGASAITRSSNVLLTRPPRSAPKMFYVCASKPTTFTPRRVPHCPRGNDEGWCVLSVHHVDYSSDPDGQVHHGCDHGQEDVALDSSVELPHLHRGNRTRGRGGCAASQFGKHAAASQQRVQQFLEVARWDPHPAKQRRDRQSIDRSPPPHKRKPKPWANQRRGVRLLRTERAHAIVSSFDVGRHTTRPKLAR